MMITITKRADGSEHRLMFTPESKEEIDILSALCEAGSTRFEQVEHYEMNSLKSIVLRGGNAVVLIHESASKDLDSAATEQ